MSLEGWVTTAQEAQHPGISEESSARQTAFTKLTAEVEMENGDKTVADRRNTSADEQPEALKTDLRESQQNQISPVMKKLTLVKLWQRFCRMCGLINQHRL